MNKLTEIQKQILWELEPQFTSALNNKQLSFAAKILTQIKNLLLPTKHEARLMLYENRLFEAHMDNSSYKSAINGFSSIRQRANKRTRLYLEASAMLAICYLRTKEVDKAEPIIQEVLKNETVITSPSRRFSFRERIIERFNEEGILFSLRGEGQDILNINDIDKNILTTMHLSVEEVLQSIGESVPANSTNILCRIDDFSKKQLPSGERRLLSPPIKQNDKEKIGKTVFSSIKRTLYNSICDPNSDTYKAWYNNGLQIVLDKKYITSAVVTLFAGLGIGIKALAISVAALIVKFGIEVFCNHHKPSGIMDLR
jgi:hypothetical protein